MVCQMTNTTTFLNLHHTTTRLPHFRTSLYSENKLRLANFKEKGSVMHTTDMVGLLDNIISTNIDKVVKCIIKSFLVL